MRKGNRSGPGRYNTRAMRKSPCLIPLLLLAATAGAKAEPPATGSRIEAELREVVRKAAPATVTVAEGGSGVIISPDGLVLTNFHVAGQWPACDVGLPGNRKLLATRLGVDQQGDLCLLKLEAPPGEPPFPYAEFGDSDALRTGHCVIAMGNGFMTAQTTYEPSVSFGIVSGLRRFNALGGGFIYGNCIQHDAAINPGNSGGPLFDIEGRLVGINGKIEIRRGRVHSGIGYAIPVNGIRACLEVMKQGKPVVHGWSGIDAKDTPDRKGVRIAQVAPGSPADAAGLKPGDVIVKLADRPVAEEADFFNAHWSHLAGETVPFQVVRAGAPQKLDVKLGTPPQQPAQQGGQKPPGRGGPKKGGPGGPPRKPQEQK